MLSDVAEVVLNRCMVSNETKDGKIRRDTDEYTITFDYEFVEDFQDASESIWSSLLRRYIQKIIIIGPSKLD
jgi:hypothetical protein